MLRGCQSLSELALSLVQHLGYEEAKKVCEENSWYGVLNIIIENYKNNP